MRGLRAATGFLTIAGRAAAPDPAALTWFPAVGAGIGLAVGVVWWAAAHWWPPGVAAGLAVGADLAITGMLHLDGLCDAADGLLPPRDRGARLRIMAEPGTGAFGVGAAVLVLGLRWVALAALRPDPLLPVALWATSRAAMAGVIAAGVPYARAGGSAEGFGAAHGRDARALVIAVVGAGAALVLAVAWRPLAGSVAVVAAVVAAGAVVGFAQRRLGGFTGDVLGAAGLVAETVGLVVAAARW